MKMEANSPDLWRDLSPTPSAEGHKYNRGHLLVLGGDFPGAAIMVSKAAARIGAGAVTIHYPQDPDKQVFYAAGWATAPHLMMEPYKTLDFDKMPDRLLKSTAFVIGSGFGPGSALKKFVCAALATGKPCVLDADALTAFENEPQTLFNLLHDKVVITPHEGEFGRLFAPVTDRLQAAAMAVEQMPAVLILKGARTIIAQRDNPAIINSNAPPTLATAGSGDTLAGIIGGLMAQGMPARSAAAAGVWCHGAAGEAFGRGLVAGDLADLLPAVLTKLQGPQPKPSPGNNLDV